MRPVADRGTQVIVRAVPARQLRPGDVFLFALEGGDVELHRLVMAVPGGWLVHRGDNQAVRGFGVTRVERVIGKAELARVVPARRERARAAIEVARRGIRRLRRRRTR